MQTTIVESTLSQEKEALKQAKVNLASYQAELVRQETIQNAGIAKSKQFSFVTQISGIENRIRYLKQLLAQENKSISDELFTRYQSNYQHSSSNGFDYLWQLVGSVDDILKSRLTFLIDKHVFLDGKATFSLLSDAFIAFGGAASLVNIIPEQQPADKTIDERGVEAVWDNLIKESEEQGGKRVFFLDLEKLTPVKILLLAKLQKHFANSKNDRQSGLLNLIIYTDDVLSSQLKVPGFQPQIEIVFEEHRMPCRLNFATTDQVLTNISRTKEIKRIVDESIEKYKKTFMRFDFLIFLKSQADADYLVEHALKYTRDPLNIINVIDAPLDQDQAKPSEEKAAKEETESEDHKPSGEAEEAKDSVEKPVEQKEDVFGTSHLGSTEEGETLSQVQVVRRVKSYQKGEFNVIIAKSHKQLRAYNLDNVLVSIDSGEGEKVYYIDSIFESIPTLSSKITREESVKRERLVGNTISGDIYRLYSRKEFLRLQKRDFLNTLNFERFRNFTEIAAETCEETQALRILLYVCVNLAESWFSCSTVTGAHVSLLWSRMGDVFSLANCIQSIPNDSHSRLSCQNLNLCELLEKNQINSYQFDKLLCELKSISTSLNIKQDVISTIQRLDKQKLSEVLQRIVIEKYYKNLCVYSGHRRHGFKHFTSNQHVHYADQCSMQLIQERPFLLIPLQLSINAKNQLEIKQAIAVDHMFFLESAPNAFIDQYKLRLLKRQSLNLHEVEYFGISSAMFQHFTLNQNLIKDFESKYECYYEPNLHMDSITIHCDAANKEKIEKNFEELMAAAKKVIDEEILEFPQGKNSIVKLTKGGMVKEVIILENQHEFYVDNLPPTVKEEDLIELFSEYGGILKVRFFDPAIESDQISSEKTLSAEVLVAETEDSAFFVEAFDQILFQGRNLQLRNKSHSFKLKDIQEQKNYSILRWQSWKSKCVAKIEFKEVALMEEFVKRVEGTNLTLDGVNVKVEVNKNTQKNVLLKNLNKITDERTILEALKSEQNNIVAVKVDRYADNDRGTSKLLLNHLLQKMYNQVIEVKWVKRKEDGFVEAKIPFPKNRIYQMQNLTGIHGQEGKIGYQKLYVEHQYVHSFSYDMKMQKILDMILHSNEELLNMQRSEIITIKSKIVRPVPSKQEILIKIQSKEEGKFQTAKDILTMLLSPKILDLRNIKLDLASLFDEEDQVDYSQIFTQIGQKKLKELEEKYPVLFKINLKKEEVRVFCTDSIYSLINKDVEYFLRQSIRVKIPVNGKNIRNVLGIDGKGLEELQQKFSLVKIQLDYISKDVYMQGDSKSVDKATNALLALLEEKNSSSYSYEECQVCSDTIQTGYRLQGCGHKFCVNCMMFVIENSLGDMNSFPIKCPCCSVSLVLRDILALMSEEQVEKMQRMSLNKYVQTNFTSLTYCVNENCRSVHSSTLTKYTCYECKKTFCSKCSTDYHFGYTCTQYQETEAKNIEYLIKEGARKCPQCGVYIIRIDGCYRVECQRCNCHICWKDNCMIFFKTATECYNHLDEKHNGYW